MRKLVAFKATYLEDGHLSIPKDVAASLFLKEGEEVQVVIEKGRFDKKGFLSLSGIWKEKTEQEIHLYREIMKEREGFGRGEIEL
jgi:predicted DNA-binding antitoxin AbrB/MazE fold protein